MGEAMWIYTYNIYTYIYMYKARKHGKWHEDIDDPQKSFRD